MKRLISSMALLGMAMIMVVSCDMEIEPIEKVSGTSVAKEYTGSMEESEPETKTGFDSNLKVVWLGDEADTDSGNDRISVFQYYSNLNYEYKVKSGFGTNNVVFEAVDATGTQDGEKLTTNYAVYPYSASNTLSGTTVTTSIPAEQTYVEKSFMSGAAPMTSSTTGTDFSFKNNFSIIRLNVYSEVEDVVLNKVVVSANENMAGNATVDIASDSPVAVITDDASASKSVTVTCGEGISVPVASSTADAIPVYIILAPGTYSGLELEFETNKGTVTAKLTGSVALNRNIIKTLNKKFKFADFGFTKFSKVASNDDMDDSGDYILVYKNGTDYNAFSFSKTMANAETAADIVADVHGLSALKGYGTQVYQTILDGNYQTLTAGSSDDVLYVSKDVEDVVISATGCGYGEGTATLNATVEGKDYTLGMSNVYVSFADDGAATITAAFDATDIKNILTSLRGNEITVTFENVINFLGEEANLTDTQLEKALAGFDRVCQLAKEEFAEHDLGTLMDITTKTYVMDVFVHYYDNFISLSDLYSSDKAFGFAKPFGFYAANNGFSFNIPMPNKVWFTYIQESFDAAMEGSTWEEMKTNFTNYWKRFDSKFQFADYTDLCSRLANKATASTSQATFEVLAGVDWSGLGNIYGSYVNRINDDLENVYLYKKAAE